MWDYFENPDYYWVGTIIFIILIIIKELRERRKK